jgi:hypothetical protein
MDRPWETTTSKILIFILSPSNSRSGTTPQFGRSRVQFPIMSLEFITVINLPAEIWPWGRLSLEQIWVSGTFPGEDKGGRCVGLTTLPPSCADSFEIWEPQIPGTLRVRPGLYGIALPLPLPTNLRMHKHVRHEWKYCAGINIHVLFINSKY